MTTTSHKWLSMERTDMAIKVLELETLNEDGERSGSVTVDHFGPGFGGVYIEVSDATYFQEPKERSNMTELTPAQAREVAAALLAAADELDPPGAE